MEMTNFNSNGVDLTLRSPFPACHGTKKNSSLSQEALKRRTLQCVFVERKRGDFPQYLIQKPSLNVLFEHHFPSLMQLANSPSISPTPGLSMSGFSPFLILPFPALRCWAPPCHQPPSHPQPQQVWSFWTAFCSAYVVLSLFFQPAGFLNLGTIDSLGCIILC